MARDRPLRALQDRGGSEPVRQGEGRAHAMVIPSLALHIGDKRHADDPFQPRRATTPTARLKRSITNAGID